FRDCSQPSSTLPLQSPKRASHEVRTQLPLAQVPAPFAGAQAVPHLPQLVAFLSESSQPLSTFPSQSPKPASQVPTAHLPAMHAAVARGGVAQALVQLPQ